MMLEIRIECNECGHDLEVIVSDSTFYVKPCPTCLAQEHDNGFEQGQEQGYKDGQKYGKEDVN